MLDMVDAGVRRGIILILPVEPVVQVSLAGGVVDSSRNLVVPPVKRPVLVGPVLERLGGAQLERRRDKVQGSLLQAELGFGVVVWITHRNTMARSAIQKPRNIQAMGAFPENPNTTNAVRSITVLANTTPLPKSTEPPTDVVHAGHEPAPCIFDRPADNHIGRFAGRQNHLI